MAKSIAMVDPSVNPDDLIIPARNAKGETERQWFKCSPDLDRALSVIHASKKFPWKTVGDQIRCYVHHGAKWAEKHAGVHTSLQAAEMMYAFIRAEDEAQQFQQNIELARKVVQRFI